MLFYKSAIYYFDAAKPLILYFLLRGNLKEAKKGSFKKDGSLFILLF